MSFMSELLNHTVSCPYCGEAIDVLIDTSVPQQDYIEDCQVCCAPINFAVTANPDGSVDARVSTDNE